MIDFLARVPSTNLRIFVSVALAVVYVIGTMMAGLLERPLEATNVITLGGFILTMMGLDVAQFAVKRRTHQRFADDPEVDDG